MLRVLLHIVRLAFLQQLTYRTAAIAGLVTNLFFGLMRAFVVIALYDGQESVNGLSLQGAVTYVAFSQAMIAFLSIFGSSDFMNSVSSGAVGSDLLRPLHLYAWWMARDLGRSLVNLWLRGLLLLGIYALFFSIVIPTQGWQWLGLLLAVIFSWLVSFSWRFLVNLAAFWSPDARGIGRLAFIFSQLLSGFLMPLRLYPDWFLQLCQLTPFPALFNTSVEIYLGILSPSEMWLAIFNQAAWFVVLSLLSLAVLSAGVKRLVIQGG